MNVLWRTLELGKNCQIMAGIAGLRVVNFEQCSFVTLHN
jgi:hypothetical protein